MRNCTLSTIVMLGMAFNFILSFSTAHAQGFPEPVLDFDALKTDQKGGDKAWRNAGTAGGEVDRTGNPELESGLIEIPAIKFKQDTKWYTAKNPVRRSAITRREVMSLLSTSRTLPWRCC